MSEDVPDDRKDKSNNIDSILDAVKKIIYDNFEDNAFKIDIYISDYIPDKDDKRGDDDISTMLGIESAPDFLEVYDIKEREFIIKVREMTDIMELCSDKIINCDDEPDIYDSCDMDYLSSNDFLIASEITGYLEDCMSKDKEFVGLRLYPHPMSSKNNKTLVDTDPDGQLRVYSQPTSMIISYSKDDEIMSADVYGAQDWVTKEKLIDKFFRHDECY